MPKGIFTQCAAILLRRTIDVVQLEQALRPFMIERDNDALASAAFVGPSLLLAFRPEVNGCVLVDIVDFPWPDDMGGPKKDATIFGAWATGQFGPFTFPGALGRAGRQCWGWDSGMMVANQHNAFVRIRSSYVLGATGDAPLLPGDYDPVRELAFVSDIALAALKLPAALCYFNPGGEVLAPRQAVQESLEHARSAQLPPFEIWANVRFFGLDPDWSVMDVVGNGQLDVMDLEAWLPPGEAYEPVEVMVFLRNITLDLVNSGKRVKDGDTREGPRGIRWRAKTFNKAFAEPQRRVISWVPLDGSQPPSQLSKR